MTIIRAISPLALLLTAATVAGSPRAPAMTAPIDAIRAADTLVLAIELDRDSARLVAYTLKPRRFQQPLAVAAARHFQDGDDVQVEVTLSDGQHARFTRRVDAGTVCLDHDPTAPPHVEGDTIRHHRDSFLVELPQLPGLDTVEVAIFDGLPSQPVRRLLAVESIRRALYAPAAGPSRHADPGFASPIEGTDRSVTPGTVHWPEEYSDPDLYRVYGDETELDRRINVVIVPDGYRYGDKLRMETHAQELVDHFRAKIPFAEHDLFFNYILVYGYSTESGTDQCDCGTILDTAFSTRFPDAGGACGDSANRCLSYAGGCDPGASTANLIAAELRAPAHDETLVMVNTTRYGGCGGSRATFSAGNSSARELAVHEFGHSLGNLRDEYAGNPSCGSSTGLNVSTDPVNGTWPEWIGDIGAPREGARTYDNCVYRPLANCEMRSLNQPFCPVCNQYWALGFFGHARIAPTAPIESMAPASPVAVVPGGAVDFAIATRLAVAAGVINDFTWTIEGPGYPTPTVIGTASPTLRHTFPAAGTFTVACELIADVNFIKPVKNGANRELATWTIEVVCDVPTDPLGNLLLATKTTSGAQFRWADAPGVTAYEVGRSATRDFGAPIASIGTVTSGSPGIEDPTALALPALHTYRVAESGCGGSGPW